jgi:hypothetical protein
MLTKSKSCPNINYAYDSNLSNSYGMFLQINPKASKAERCMAIKKFYENKK